MVTSARAKVCHIITMLELGGAQQNTLYTVRNLDRERFDPVLITGTEGPLVDEARESPVTSHFLPDLKRAISPAGDLRALLALKRVLRHERPDIVHTHSSKAGILGRAAAAMAGIRVVIHSVHGWGFHPGQSLLAHGLYVTLERLAALKTSAFITVSRANLAQGVAARIFDEGSARVIHSGIALERFRPRAADGEAADLPWPSPGTEEVIVGMVACFKPQKAPLDFIRVAAEVLKRAPHCRFVLVGDGELRGAIEHEITALGIGARVNLLGWRRDIPELMRHFDVLLHTSRWEGLPRVFPEAMASSLPIVATSVDGAPEAIEDGVSGFLREPGDIRGLGEAVVQLAESAKLRGEMGRSGKSRVEAWDIDRMVRDQENLYLELLGRFAGRRYNSVGPDEPDSGIEKN
jgi:glycosyltransferase involved in cell wall biosynthesis